MKANLPLLLLFCLALLTACNKDEVAPENICETVTLIANDTGLRFDKTIVLYEDSAYLIKAPINLFVSDLYGYFVDYGDYLSTVGQIVNAAEAQDTLYVENYFPTEQKMSVVAHVLERGDCYVYSKRRQSALKELCLTRFSCAAPVAGVLGREFYFDEKLFLKIVDGNC
ncbi:hypothetical protein I2I11_08905 [Pontibacter sp. 172403-2]|uniref:hypothetical protein n=1 Tax=Pontibacter rufus TaxID=2791028 RepID=UPI0018AFFF61|nr:hypothetical protein [Pontibacter sp. 172403-2]MBF9253409.1 hypothetical protein [Pontibacter sp. 172403-2]